MWFKSLLLVLLTVFGATLGPSSHAQSLEYPSNYTMPGAVPRGCLLLMPSLLDPPETVFYDETFLVDGLVGTTTVRIKVWRIGCHEPGRSAIVLNLLVPESPATGLQSPFAFLIPSGTNTPQSAFLSLFSGLTVPASLQGLGDLLGAVSNANFFADGVTYVVHSPPTISTNQYNDDIGLFLDFGLDSMGRDQQVLIPVFSYVPALDPPQLPLPAFHGRYSGQWTAEGVLPASGLQLMIGEIPNSNRQFMFAIYFTYIDGFPTWVVGNPDFEVGANEVSMDMLFVEGGEFITQPGSYTSGDLDVQVIGTMTLRAVHCNQIEADIDFTVSGNGSTSLTLDRLVRVAGYDCDQTQ